MQVHLVDGTYERCSEVRAVLRIPGIPPVCDRR